MAASADAAVIYSGLRNISAHIIPGKQANSFQFYEYELRGVALNGGADDLFLEVGFFADRTLPTHIPIRVLYYGVANLLASLGASLAATTHAGRVISRFSAGETVGPGENFRAGIGLHLGERLEGASQSSVTHATFGPFGLGTTGFVGFRLTNGDYGWIRVRLDDTGLQQPFKDLLGSMGLGPLGDGENYPDKLTVIDWAYDDSGAPIHVGDTGGTGGTAPEPSSLALLAAGALGLAAFRRRKQGKSSLKTRT